MNWPRTRPALWRWAALLVFATVGCMPTPVGQRTVTAPADAVATPATVAAQTAPHGIAAIEDAAATADPGAGMALDRSGYPLAPRPDERLALLPAVVQGDRAPGDGSSARLSGSEGEPASSASTTCSGLATRRGQDLVIDGQPIFFFGLNAPYLLDAEFPEGRVEPLLAALSERGVNTLRVWFFSRHDPDRLARLLDAGSHNGIRFVVTLEDNVFRGRDWFFSTEDETVYRPHLQRTVARFKDRPEILLWEAMNEPNCGEGRHDDDCLDAIREWLVMAAGMVKAIDPCHAVSTGMIGAGNYDNELVSFRRLHGKDAIDLVSIHRRAVAESDKERDVAEEENRPFYYGEIYFEAYDPGCNPLGGSDSPRERAEEIEDDLRGAVDDRAAGYLLWDFSANRVTLNDGSERDYCSSFGYPLDDPLWPRLREASLPPPVPWR